MNETRPQIAAQTAPVTIIVNGPLAYVEAPNADLVAPVLERPGYEFDVSGPTGVAHWKTTTKHYRRGRRGPLFFFAGLVPRVAQFLKARGCQVAVDDRTHCTWLDDAERVAKEFTDLTEEEQRFAAAICHSPHGQLITRNTKETAWAIALMLDMFPKLNLIVVTKNKLQAGLLHRLIAEHTDRRIALYPQLPWAMRINPWAIIFTGHLFSDCDLEFWQLVIFANGGGGVGQEGQETTAQRISGQGMECDRVGDQQRGQRDEYQFQITDGSRDGINEISTHGIAEKQDQHGRQDQLQQGCGAEDHPQHHDVGSVPAQRDTWGVAIVYGFGRFSQNYLSSDRIPVASHEGDRREMLRRYERSAAQAVMEGPKGIRKIGPDLFEYASDPRILREAWDSLKMYGGAAPGPNGRTYTDYGNREVWEMLGAYSESIRKGTYRPGPDRIDPISKGGNRGTRTLRLQDIHDRVVARSIVEIIQPLLDPGFDPFSFGFRPNRDRLHALATAMHLAETQDRMFFVLEDVKNAFDNVPVQRLLDIVRKRLPNAGDLWQLIEIVVGNGTKRGIRQGSPLSPILLNLYLDHVLDRPWRERHPDAPLLRSADDILVLCRTREKAPEVQHDLRGLLTPAGMPLKRSFHAIRNLNDGDKADWLGYQIFKGNNGLTVRISVDTWSVLEGRLLQAHDKPASPLRAVQIVEG